jgi:hypothetical protein
MISQRIHKSLLVELANVNRLVLLDLDDTLVEPAEIFIYRQFPGEEEVALTPSEYAEEEVTPETQKYYDYRDFMDPDTVQLSIKTGEPIVANLEVMDDFINRGYSVGILTARSEEDIIYNTLREWLMYRNKRGELVPLGDRLSRELVFAINDPKTSSQLRSTSDYNKKAEVIDMLLDEFDEVIFLDDDNKNLKAIRQLKANLERSKANKLFIMKAKI